jgi:hypothetical protein
MENRYQSLQTQGYKQYLLINDGSGFGSTPTATYCKQVRTQYGLTFPVLYDPVGTFTSTFGFAGSNEQNLVLEEGGVIVFKGRYTSQTTVLQQIQSALP